MSRGDIKAMYVPSTLRRPCTPSSFPAPPLPTPSHSLMHAMSSSYFHLLHPHRSLFQFVRCTSRHTRVATHAPQTFHTAEVKAESGAQERRAYDSGVEKSTTSHSCSRSAQTSRQALTCSKTGPPMSHTVRGKISPALKPKLQQRTSGSTGIIGTRARGCQHCPYALVPMLQVQVTVRVI